MGNEVEKEIYLTTDIILTIQCGSGYYRFNYREEGTDETNWIGTIPNKAATAAPPVGAPFTGMMFGLYAFGDRQRCLVPADFRYAQISWP